MKDTAKGVKWQTADCEKMFASHISDWQFVSKIYDQLSKFSVRKQRTNK